MEMKALDCRAQVSGSKLDPAITIALTVPSELGLAAPSKTTLNFVVVHFENIGINNDMQ